MIQAASKHLATLVDEVLDLSRIESGNVSISLEHVPVAPLVQEAVDLVRPLAASRKVVIDAPPPAAACGYVLADAQRLKQVVINLLVNAIKFNHEGGQVRVAVAPGADDCVRITVEDTGKGIPESSLAKLFTPFERLDAAAAGVEGTGLGLALSRTLVEGMGGTLTVESTPGVGSAFAVELGGGEPAAVETLTPGRSELVAVRRYRSERRLLYIEDTVANVRLIEEILRRRPSVRLLPAMLGQLGLELARQHRPDLVLLDLHLPDLDGEEVLARLRADPTTRGIPVVALSADAKRGRDPVLAGGAAAYLTKPITVQRLLEVMDEFFAEQPDGDQPSAA